MSTSQSENDGNQSDLGISEEADETEESQLPLGPPTTSAPEANPKRGRGRGRARIARTGQRGRPKKIYSGSESDNDPRESKKGKGKAKRGQSKQQKAGREKVIKPEDVEDFLESMIMSFTWDEKIDFSMDIESRYVLPFNTFNGDSSFPSFCLLIDHLARTKN